MNTNVERITYTSWEGDAAILVRYKDGRIYGFTRYTSDGPWKQGHDADIATKAAVLTETEFNRRFGSPTLPTLPN